MGCDEKGVVLNDYGKMISLTSYLRSTTPETTETLQAFAHALPVSEPFELCLIIIDSSWGAGCISDG